MICKQILLITFLNKPQLILKWFQVFLFYQTQMILFTINAIIALY